MLERFFVRPTTVDRIRGSWLGKPIEQYVSWLAEHGYDPQMGARPMARLVEQKLKKPLAEAMVFGSLKEGGTAMAEVQDGDIVLSFAETNAPRADA